MTKTGKTQMTFEMHAETLPLFSGTAMRGAVDVFAPGPAIRQEVMFCGICRGIGFVILKGKKVTCPCQLKNREEN